MPQRRAQTASRCSRSKLDALLSPRPRPVLLSVTTAHAAAFGWRTSFIGRTRIPAAAVREVGQVCAWNSQLLKQELTILLLETRKIRDSPETDAGGPKHGAPSPCPSPRTSAGPLRGALLRTGPCVSPTSPSPLLPLHQHRKKQTVSTKKRLISEDFKCNQTSHPESPLSSMQSFFEASALCHPVSPVITSVPQSGFFLITRKHETRYGFRGLSPDPRNHIP